MSLPIGKFRAVAINDSAIEGTTPNGSPFVEVTFRVIEEGEHKGKEMRKSFYLTGGAIEFSMKDLRTCGCTFPGGDVFNYAGLGTREVEIVVQKQKPKPGETESRFNEIRFINDPHRQRDVPQMDAAKKEELRRALRGAVLASAAESAKPQASRDTDFP
jgi:hypothetical protein